MYHVYQIYIVICLLILVIHHHLVVVIQHLVVIHSHNHLSLHHEKSFNIHLLRSHRFFIHRSYIVYASKLFLSYFVDIVYMPTKNLYFHSGGFYAMPHFIGAIDKLRRKKRKNYTYYGNSAGASWCLVCYLILNGYIDLDYTRVEVQKVFAKSRPVSPILTPIYCDLIDIMAPFWPPDLAQRVSGILHVGVTTKTGHKFINQFATNADLYNALLCSGTIALCSDYESVIDGEVCLDGGYTFQEHMLPENTTIIASDVLVLLSLTVPPPIVCPLLEANGRRNVERGLEKPIILYNGNPTEMYSWFFLHKSIPKDSTWATHIANMTRS